MASDQERRCLHGSSRDRRPQRRPVPTACHASQPHPPARFESRQGVQKRDGGPQKPTEQTKHPCGETNGPLRPSERQRDNLAHDPHRQDSRTEGKQAQREPPATALKMAGDGARKRTRKREEHGRHIPILPAVAGRLPAQPTSRQSREDHHKPKKNLQVNSREDLRENAHRHRWPS